MKISDAKILLTQVVKHNIERLSAGASHSAYLVPFFTGDPGLGKTAIPIQVAEELGLPYHETIVAQYDAGEMSGLPFVGKVDIPIGEKTYNTAEEASAAAKEFNNTIMVCDVDVLMEDGSHQKMRKYRPSFQVDRMIRLRPTYLPDPEHPDGEVGIYNLDELPQAFLANQNVCSQLVNCWRIGEHKISPGMTICGTGNKPENKAGTTTMPTHLRDRLMFIPIEVDHNDWLVWAAQAGVDPRVRSYLRQNPARLHKFQVAANANPTPRSWDKTSSIIKMDLPKHVRKQAMDGQIGEGEATSFETWLRVEDRMPKLEDILTKPNEAPVFQNKDADILYLLLANLADISNEQNIQNILTYVTRLPNKEFMAVYAQDAFSKNKKLLENKHVTTWKMKEVGKILW